MNSIIGPINVSQPFIIVASDATNQYVLDSKTLGNNITYYLNNDPTTVNNLPVFSATGAVDNLRLFDITNSVVTGLVTNTNILGIDTPVNLNFEQSVAATWWAPAILLSSVLYNIKNNSQQLMIYTTSTGTNPVAATQLLPLPATWYGSCLNGEYDSVSNASATLENWFCLISPTNSACNEVSILPEGWTVLNECQQQLRYNYCPIGKGCSYNNCNGPCSKEYYDCTATNQEFTCKFDSTKYYEDVSWWTSPLFIGGVIGIIVIIIVIIILIVITIRKRSKANL